MSFAFLKSNKHDWLNGSSFEDRVFTPDAAYLEQLDWHRLFVYNNWQSGQRGADKLSDGVKLSAAATTGANFVVLKKKLGKESFPIALELEAEKYTFGRETFYGPRGQILGQLFFVTPETIKSLDKEVYNTVQFDRQRINIDVEYRDREGSWLSDKKVARMKAWAYIARTDFWIDGHGINDTFFAPVRRCVTVHSNLNSEKQSQTRYYFNDKFETD